MRHIAKVLARIRGATVKVEPGEEVAVECSACTSVMRVTGIGTWKVICACGGRVHVADGGA